MSITNKKLKNAKTQNRPQKIVVVVGPTASGKSEFAVKLAKKYKGEIISADSRQVYKGLDIGTGKVLGHWTSIKNGKLKIGNSRVFMYKGVAHYCIDFVSPKRQYTVADFKRDGTKALLDIIARGKTPIICGGTGQYVDALLTDQVLPEVPPDSSLRAKLEKKTTTQLFAELKKKDPVRAASIDPHNPRRLIRALEIIATLGKVPEAFKHVNIQTYKPHGLELPVEIHYLNPLREELYAKIEKRLIERVTEGMLQEAITLHSKGLSWKRMYELGLEYRFISRYLKSVSKLSSKLQKDPNNFIKSTYFTELLSEIKHYAKRQQTWFKKYKK